MSELTPRSGAPATGLSVELDRVLSVRGAEREDRLLASEHLDLLVPRLPPEEFFFTLKEAQEENVPALLAPARPEQLQFVLDLELWHKDRFRRDRVPGWLSLLSRCGDPAVGRWLRGIDLETWTLLLSGLAGVTVASEEHDPVQEATGRAPFTLDGVYYVCSPEEAEPAVRGLLKVLRALDADLYYRLLESLVRDVGSELEEQCFEGKQRRLAERGFPDWEEAFHVYSKLAVESLSALPRRTETAPHEAEAPPPAAPRYPVALAGAVPDLFTRALERVGAPSLEGLRGELANLTNKVAVADGLDVSRLESFPKALHRVVSYVSIALEALGAPDPDAAAAAVEAHWLQDLFRVGWTQIRVAQSKARKFLDKGWPSGRMERLLFLDPPLPQIIDGLLRRHPLWYAGEDEPSFREFRSFDEVLRADRAVEKAAFLGEFLLSVVDFRLKDLQKAVVRLDAESLSGTSVFLTSMVNAALGRDFRFAPIERDAAREALARLWRDGEAPRRVKADLLDSALEWSARLHPVLDDQQGYLREFISEALALLEEEFGHLPPEEMPDPRFTRGLWLT